MRSADLVSLCLAGDQTSLLTVGGRLGSVESRRDSGRIRRTNDKQHRKHWGLQLRSHSAIQFSEEKSNIFTTKLLFRDDENVAERNASNARRALTVQLRNENLELR